MNRIKNLILGNRRLWLFIGIGLVLLFAGAVYYGRGPDFTIEWKRDVPSRLSMEELAPALNDIRNWPIYFHDLRTARIESPLESAKSFEIPSVGTEVLLEIEPKGREWKRYTVRGKVIELDPGKKIRFALVNESTGKTSRLLRGLEWEVSIRPTEGRWKEKGYRSVIHGEARADTVNSRSRLLGRVADRSLMNQSYWVDLVRLANFVDNQAAWAENYAPVYR